MLELASDTHVTDELVLSSKPANMSSPISNCRQMSASKYFIDGRRDSDLFHVANSLIKGYLEEDIAREVLSIIASQCYPPFPDREVQFKIDSAIQRAKSREQSLAKEVREFIMSPQMSPNVFMCPQERNKKI
jgi:hypothetical protein